ncbi:unnamed protein product [Sphenostylis stenocarpa]|uniref:FAS1 domain-containing protein n=1 Tax=Sphenostylis stenocarpa TaxID=92480 RepID=A0AA86T4D1_9FABA|nr:unnamed protein product [Sphenostylis stenocarpa]
MALVVAICSTIHALDITKELSAYPEFALFSKALTEAKLVDKINALNAVTILAIDDAATATLAGKSPDAVKAILSTHVLTDYYDEKKLVEAQGSHSLVETLFQSSGVAKNNQGYIYIMLINEGEVAFGSAASPPGIDFDVVLVHTVTNQTGVFSILQVNKPIVPAGIDISNVTIPQLAGDKTAETPSALAPATAPSSASRVFIGLLGAASAFAAFFLAL